ncbi:MAG: hypothetical protein WCI47_03865 [bacterium]
MFPIFIGLIMVILGTLMLRYTQQIYNFTGALDFVENKVTAGTPGFIKLFGLALVLIGLGTIFGLWTFLTDPLGDSLKSMFGAGQK